MSRALIVTRLVILGACGLVLVYQAHAQASCETIQDQQARNDCFARAGVPVIDCSQPRNADEAAFCRTIPANNSANRGVPPAAPQSQNDAAEPASNATCFTGPGLPLCVPADQIWYKSATEWYNPSTYCKWGREQLPQRLQKVCSELARKYPPRRANWKRIEADNGAVYAIDLNSISHVTNGGADATMCMVDNDTCLIPNETRLRFDCRGHYIDPLGGGGMQMAPPRSVAGQMAALACAAH